MYWAHIYRFLHVFLLIIHNLIGIIQFSCFQPFFTWFIDSIMIASYRFLFLFLVILILLAVDVSAHRKSRNRKNRKYKNYKKDKKNNNARTRPPKLSTDMSSTSNSATLWILCLPQCLPQIIDSLVNVWNKKQLSWCSFCFSIARIQIVLYWYYFVGIRLWCQWPRSNRVLSHGDVS